MMHPLEARLAAVWPPRNWHEVTVLLAVSGGADSVALLRAMTALHTGGLGGLAAAHFNHQLRGRESTADEAFVVQLCRDLNVPCDVDRITTSSTSLPSKDGVEAMARKARYEFLALAAARRGARYIVTAHTADDQAETILHHVLRGTGLGGLTGMARARPFPLPPYDGAPAALIRPFLTFRRAETTSYLNDIGQPFRHDSSNDDLRFTRNRIRLELLPSIAEHINPGVVDALLRLGKLADEAQEVIDRLADGLYKQCATVESGATSIDTRPLREQPGYLIRELLMLAWRKRQWPMQAMGFQQWDLLGQMVLSSTKNAAGQPQKHTFPGGILAEAGPDRLLLFRSEQLGRVDQPEQDRGGHVN
jgi:tRNA(Ile)-lysidine synthase